MSKEKIHINGEELTPITQVEFEKSSRFGGINFARCYFENVTFQMNADNADFSGSRFMDCKFQNCSMQNADFSGATINADFINTSMCLSNFSNCNIYHTAIKDSSFAQANFENASFKHVSFNETNLQFANFLCAKMDSVYMRNIESVGVQNVDTVSITMGGATDIEVENHRRQILLALNTTREEPMKPYEIDRIKRTYQSGARVECIAMQDANAVPTGTKGTVNFVDDIGTVHVTWDNGQNLGLCKGEDRFKLLPDEQVKKAAHAQEKSKKSPQISDRNER